MSTKSKKSSDSKKEGGCYSYSEEHTIVYTWKINSIRSFFNSARSTKGRSSLKSSEFSTNARILDLWCLELAIQEDDDLLKKKTWVSVFLYSKNRDKKIRVKFSLFLLNTRKEKVINVVKIFNKSPDYWTDHLFVDSKGFGINEFVKIDKLLEEKDDLLQNDTLTVCVDLIVYDEYVIIKNPINSLEDSEQTLADNFKDLLITKKKCDVVIIVGDKKFDAHKVILIARSSVFEAMFSHDMKENKENKLTIPDIDPNVFKKVLDFIYTDKIDNLNSFAEELLEASDKYQLQKLKKMCENYLSKILSFDNAIRIMILADRHNAKQLNELAFNYVAENWVEFKNTDDYKVLEITQPSLAYDILKTYANGIKTKQ